MELFRLFGSVVIDNDDAIKSLKDADKKARDSKRVFRDMGDTLKKIGKVAAVGIAGATTALIGLAKSSADTADTIHKGSQRMGISTDAYQEMEYWASQNGLAQEQLEKGIGRLNQRMGAAADGNEKYSGALEKLGINMDEVRDGTLSTEDAFTQSIKSLSEMENGQEQAALASELFGTKLGRDLLPTLQDGALGIEEAKQKAQDLGIVLGESAVNDGVLFTDTMDDLKRSVGGVANKVGLAVIPKLQMFLDWVVENMPLIQEKISTAMDKAKEVVDKLKNAFQFLKDNANLLIPVLAGLAAGFVAFKVISTINGMVEKAKLLMIALKGTTFAQTVAQHGLNAALMANPIGLVIAAITALIAIGVALYMNWDTVKAKAQELWNKMKEVATGVKTSFTDMKNKAISAVNSMVSGAVNKFNELKTKAMNKVTGLKDDAINKFNEMKSNVVSKVNEIKNNAVDRFNELKTGVVNKITSTVTSVKTKFSEVYNGIMNPINRAKTAVQRAINKMKSYFNFDWKLPKIKMPHFSVSGSANPFDWLKEGVPSLSVEWYAKGGIFDKPTLFPADGGFNGVGEAGPEAVLPLNKETLADIGKGIASTMNGGKDIVQNVTINSPQALSPAETARENKKMLQRLALDL